MARVATEDLSKQFREPGGQTIWAVKQVNLHVEKGEFLVLVGPSGSGKTTLLRLIAGLEEITSGTISIDGQVVNGMPPQRRDLAMIFQQDALYPHLTVYENMALGLKLRRCPKNEIERRIQETAAMLGLSAHLARKPAELSGGERQRVALGRAIVRRPKVFLLDEPLSNLDAQLRLQMRGEIKQVQRRLSATMIYVTHDQVEALTLGERVAVMHGGAIQQLGAPLSLYQAPANRFVASFIGSPPMNFFPGRLRREAGGLCFLAGEICLRVPEPVPAELCGYAEKEVVLGLRPEHIRLDSKADRNADRVDAELEGAECLGAETYLHLNAGGRRFVARVPGGFDLQASRKCPAVFELSQAHFFDPASELAIAHPVN